LSPLINNSFSPLHPPPPSPRHQLRSCAKNFPFFSRAGHGTRAEAGPGKNKFILTLRLAFDKLVEGEAKADIDKL
jgi:hypothetical protein